MQAALPAGRHLHGLDMAGTRNRRSFLFRLTGALAAAALVLALLPLPAHAETASLKLGMSGTSVKKLQQSLVKYGYLKKADGKFGSGTKAAVMLFQKQAGLPQDGVAGAKTQSKLYALTGAVKTNQTLKVSVKSAQVKLLQQRLSSLGYLRNVKIDTSYGPATKAAVIKFQRKVGLSADGVAGPRTLIRLFSSSAPKYMTKGEQVVEYAKKYLGVKYVYGAANPNVGFDCSGLVYYIFKQYYGITLPRSARGMVNAGKKVEGGLSNAKPGDILCFGTSVSNVGHVAIYVGHNQYLHAPQTGEVVKIEVLSTKRINTCVMVRRVFNSND